MDDKEHTDVDGISRQLDAIHAGGRQLVAMVHRRIGSVLEALDDGDFAQAVANLNSAAAELSSLAHAQNYVAIADGSKTIKAADVETGMMLTSLGEVTAVEIEPCPVCRRHIKLTLGDHHELKYTGDQEVYIVVGDTAD